MYQRLVIPLDGSELAERALPAARELATALGLPLHLLRIVDVARLATYGGAGGAAEFAALEMLLQDESAAAREYLERLTADLVQEGLTVTSQQRVGMASRDLVAAMQPGDLFVLASHGRTGPKRWFLGSVAEEVIRRATVPVLLIHATEAASAEAAPAGNGETAVG